MALQRKIDFEAFVAQHPVFTLEEFAHSRGKGVDTAAAWNHLKYHLRRGRVKKVVRGVFASVPRGRNPQDHQPDPFLVAACVRPEGIFCYHAALELLGAAHTVWNENTVFCERRHPPISLPDSRVRFLVHPTALERQGASAIATRRVDHHGRMLLVTGPERTLVEGLRRPRWVGGLEEHLESTSGFGVLDLTLLERVLTAYGHQFLWAAVGWFLERNRERWFVPDELLARFEARRAGRPQYLLRGDRGGRFVARWNLIIPRGLFGWEGFNAEP